MSEEPDSLILQILRDMREKMARKDDLAELRSELKSDMHSLRADVASDFLDLRADMDGKHKHLNEQIVGLRRAVIEYHTSS